MNDNKYFYKLKYGNIYVNIFPKIFPLLLWSFFIYKYYFNYYVKITKYSFIFLFLMLLPFIVTSIEILINKDLFLNFDKLIKPTAWQSCFKIFLDDKKNNESTESNGILGKFSYQCGANQLIFCQQMMKLLQYKFYYLNFTLFLLVLISQKICPSCFFKKRN